MVATDWNGVGGLVKGMVEVRVGIRTKIRVRLGVRGPPAGLDLPGHF